MTYRKLIDQLSRIPNNRLDDDVTVYDRSTGEYTPVRCLDIADEDEQSVLDDGHPYLTIN
jgi:hypothetical protein